MTIENTLLLAFSLGLIHALYVEGADHIMVFLGWEINHDD